MRAPAPRPSTPSEPRRAGRSSPRAPERRVAAVLLAGVGAFQVALAAGAPWGAAAWGGQVEGALPPTLRIASAAAAAVYGGLAAVVVTGRPGPPARRLLLGGVSALMALGTLANLATPSPVERLWAPVAAALAVLLWRQRGPRRG